MPRISIVCEDVDVNVCMCVMHSDAGRGHLKQVVHSHFTQSELLPACRWKIVDLLQWQKLHPCNNIIIIHVNKLSEWNKLSRAVRCHIHIHRTRESERENEKWTKSETDTHTIVKFAVYIHTARTQSLQKQQMNAKELLA